MGEDDEFHKYFEDFINNETRPLLQQVSLLSVICLTN